MNTELVKNGVKQAGEYLSKNSSTILTALAVGGVVGTTLLGMDAKTKADQIIRNKEYQIYRDWLVETGGDPETYKDEPLPIKDVFLLTWKCYIPTIAMGLATISSIIGSHSIDARRNAALASLYSLAEKTLQEYKMKVVETIGEKKEEKVRQAIIQDTLDKNPVNERNVVMTGKGDSLCFDTLSGQYFMGDIEKIRRVINEFNHDILNDRWGTVNTLYDDLGLEHTSFGDNMGWSTEWGLLEVTFDTKIASDGRPCLVLVYKIQPRSL